MGGFGTNFVVTTRTNHKYEQYFSSHRQDLSSLELW